MFRAGLRLARKVMAMVFLLTDRTISRNVRATHLLVYQAKLAFEFGSRKGVTSRAWYGDRAEKQVALLWCALPPHRIALLNSRLLGYESEESGHF